MLLPDKGASSSDRGREKWGERNWGRGITERDRQGSFLSFLVVLRSTVLYFADINVSIYVSVFAVMEQEDVSAESVYVCPTIKPD